MRDGASIEFMTSEGAWHGATVVRLRSWFGRGLPLFRAGAARVAVKDELLLREPAAGEREQAMPRTVLAPLLVLLAGLVPSSPLAATAKAIPRLERVEGRHRLVAGRRLNGDERWVRLPDEGAILRVRLRLP